MAKNFIILALLGLTFFSCAPGDPVYKVLDGNSRFNQGDYAGATISYMQAMDKTKHKEWLYFNLGNAYSALGEIDPAIGELSKALEVKDDELKYRVNFNLGVIYFELGDYKNAIDHFRNALEANEKDIDAKINLELAIRRFRDDSSATSLSPSRGTAEEADERRFELIKNMEGKIWQDLKIKRPQSAEEDW